MLLCVGATPTVPNIIIAPLVNLLETFTEVLLQEIAKNILCVSKECMSMFSLSSVILFGASGISSEQG